MGAHNIEFKLPKSKYPTHEKVLEWYKGAVDEALYESGHDPYNGTISTTRGIAFHSNRFTLEDEASDYVLKHGEKWGKLCAVTLNDGNLEYWYIGGWAAS